MEHKHTVVDFKTISTMNRYRLFFNYILSWNLFLRSLLNELKQCLRLHLDHRTFTSFSSLLSPAILNGYNVSLQVRVKASYKTKLIHNILH